MEAEAGYTVIHEHPKCGGVAMKMPPGQTPGEKDWDRKVCETCGRGFWLQSSFDQTEWRAYS